MAVTPARARLATFAMLWKRLVFTEALHSLRALPRLCEAVARAPKLRSILRVPLLSQKSEILAVVTAFGFHPRGRPRTVRRARVCSMFAHSMVMNAAGNVH